MEENLRVLLDMDEVLVDFIGGACVEFGLIREQVEAHWPAGVWDIVPPLGEALAEHCPDALAWRRTGGEGKEVASWTFTEADFWKPLTTNERFWLNLKPLPWMTELLDVVRSLTDDWHIVTSPSRCPTSYSGKVKWLKNAFGLTFDRFAITSHKEIFAGPHVLLIDDRESTIDKFVSRGGEGIVFPRLHNREHARRDQPMRYIYEQLSHPKW